LSKKPDIKFSEIRTVDGLQDKGFEELRVQFPQELCGKTLMRIDRMEGRCGDGSVEAIAETDSAGKIALQTSYFAVAAD
jgi:hypothetical protein